MIIKNSWEEISRQQFIDSAVLLQKNYGEYERKIKLLWILSGLSAEEFTEIDFEVPEKEFEKLNFLNEIKFSKSFLPELGIYKGPEDVLQNFSFNQFIFSEEFLKQYSLSKKEDDLDKLLSVLYNEEKFDKENADKNFSRFSKAKQSLRQAAYLNYYGLRNFFASEFPAVFSLKEKTESESALNPWDRLIDDLAEEKIFGTIDDVGEKNVHKIFIHLQKLEEKRIESETNK